MAFEALVRALAVELDNGSSGDARSLVLQAARAAPDDLLADLAQMFRARLLRVEVDALATRASAVRVPELGQLVGLEDAHRALEWSRTQNPALFAGRVWTADDITMLFLFTAVALELADSG